MCLFRAKIEDFEVIPNQRALDVHAGCKSLLQRVLMKGVDKMNDIKQGMKVKIVKNNLRETGSCGLVNGYSPTTKLFNVELERHLPPFRGLYTEDELQKED